MSARSSPHLLAAAGSALGGILYGYALSEIAGGEKAIVERFQLGGIEFGFVVSNLDLGAAAGCLAAGLLGDRLGRKRIILATAVMYLASGILTAAAPSVHVLLLGRLLAGLAVGASLILPVYIAEVSPARWRGAMVASVQLGIVTGIVLAYAVAWLLVDAGPQSWRWTCAAGVLPALSFLASAAFLPESPRWLVLRGEEAEALAILSRVEGEGRARGAIAEISASIEAEGGGWREMFRTARRPALGVGLLVAVASVAVGINAVIYYGPSILMRGGEDSRSALLGSVYLGLVNLAATVLALPWIDRAGRKPLLLAGLAGTALSMATLGATFPSAGAPSAGSAWTLVSILSFVASYAVSLGVVTWVLVAEVFPTRIRGAAMALCLAVMYLADFAVTLVFPPLMEAAGRLTFFVFAAVSVLAGILAAVFVPETRGRTLEELEASWTRGRRGEPRQAEIRS